MPGRNGANGKRGATASASTPRAAGAEAWARQAIADLQRELTGSENQQASEAILAFASQPAIWDALCQRPDRHVAVQDLIVRRAFEMLYSQKRSIHDLDLLSQHLVTHTLDLIERLAEEAGQRYGLNPLEADDRLLFELGEQISRHTLHKSLAAHIRFRLSRPEDPVREFMQKFQYLVTQPEVSEAFVAFAATVRLPRGFVAQLRRLATDDDALKPDERLAAEFRARLQATARGDKGLAPAPEAVVRFFALPETVAFVKGFAHCRQTARALYAAEEYEDIPWQGKRRLQCTLRQGFLERALDQVVSRHLDSLDAGEGDRHELIGVAEDESLPDIRLGDSLAEWITRTALGVAPEDPLWRASKLLFVDKLAPETITRQRLASTEALASAQAQMQALLANPAVQQAWHAATHS